LASSCFYSFSYSLWILYRKASQIASWLLALGNCSVESYWCRCWALIGQRKTIKKPVGKWKSFSKRTRIIWHFGFL
jgi:hypothetical protein